MKIKKIFSDVIHIEDKKYTDERGYFFESYNKKAMGSLGINEEFIQDNISYSEKTYTLRGLHFQYPPYSQSKLIRVINGSIFDVFIDLRQKSSCFEQYSSIVIGPNDGWIYIPKGFAHGFLTLTKNTTVLYKVDSFYNSKYEHGLLWNDPYFDINWPIKNKKPILSNKDLNNDLWTNLKNRIKS